MLGTVEDPPVGSAAAGLIAAEGDLLQQASSAAAEGDLLRRLATGLLRQREVCCDWPDGPSLRPVAVAALGDLLRQSES